MKLSKPIVILSVGAAIAWGVALGALAGRTSPEAGAVRATDFNPGRIIDDAVFFDKDSMSVAEIQTFLEQKTPTCDTWGAKLVGSENWAYSGWTRAAYAAEMRAQGQDYFHAPPYICLTNYYEHPTTYKTSFETNGQRFEGSLSAAEIIYQVAQTYGISPKVLLVTLKKEYGALFVDEWPVINQFNYVMGAGCPDSGPGWSARCDPNFKGFYRQMDYAGWLFNRYRTNIASYNYQPGSWNWIQYNPNPACGYQHVYIENIATAMLYIYTPYVPNAGALANYPGTADCGAYGNRNFFMYYNEWFGSTSAFRSLDVPRWMQLKEDTRKIDVNTGEPTGAVFEKGAQAMWRDKIYVNGQWLVRSEWGKSVDEQAGFPADALEEIPFEEIKPVWMVFSVDGDKVHPTHVKNLGKVVAGTTGKFVDKITVDGETYYRSEWASKNNQSYGFSPAVLADVELSDYNRPRNMFVVSTTLKYNIAATSNIAESVERGSILMFNKLITLDGTVYVQLESDNGTMLVVPHSSLREVNDNDYVFRSLDRPRWMRLSAGSSKIGVLSNKSEGPEFGAGSDAMFVDKILVNGQWLARSAWGAKQNEMAGFPAELLVDIPVDSIDPAEMVVVRKTTKVDPISGKEFESFSAGASAVFVDKITVDRITYYRSEWAKNNGQFQFIPGDDLQIVTSR